MRCIQPALLAIFALSFSSCAYTFQGSKGSTLAEKGVHRIYIAPLRNETYKAGVENLLYNELLQSVSAGRRARVVSRPEYSDAVLKGIVRSANYTASAAQDAKALYPTTTPVISMLVATEYQAIVDCDFKLYKYGEENDPAKKPIWQASFSRARRFPASNQKGTFGTTAPLINESEFDRALRDMAHEMMRDVHESMLAMF